MFENVENVKSENKCVVSTAPITTYQELLDDLCEAEIKYSFWKNKYERQEVKLWLHTDFADVLGKAKPTETDKKMYIKEQLQDTKELRDTCKMNLEDLKKMYEISLKYGIEVLL